MQCHFVCLDTPITQVVEHVLGEMQPGSRCSDRTLDARIDGLISRLVALFGLAVQVRRDWQFTYGIQDLCEGDGWFIPLKPHGIGVTERLFFIRAKRKS